MKHACQCGKVWESVRCVCSFAVKGSGLRVCGPHLKPAVMLDEAVDELVVGRQTHRLDCGVGLGQIEDGRGQARFWVDEILALGVSHHHRGQKLPHEKQRRVVSERPRRPDLVLEEPVCEIGLRERPRAQECQNAVQILNSRVERRAADHPPVVRDQSRAHLCNLRCGASDHLALVQYDAAEFDSLEEVEGGVPGAALKGRVVAENDAVLLDRVSELGMHIAFWL